MRRWTTFFFLSLGAAWAGPAAATCRYYQDLDGDGRGVFSIWEDFPGDCGPPPVGWASVGGDCDDGNPAIYPTHPELCDGLDNDCDVKVDEGLSRTWYYPDRDADGRGGNEGSLALFQCPRPLGYAASTGDCNDWNATIYPGAPELCDGLDNDCDSLRDDGLAHQRFGSDKDGDGHPSSDEEVFACAAPPGYLAPRLGAWDCEDNNPYIYPGAFDVCDGIDNNCDGRADEDESPVVVYLDADEDGYGDPGWPLVVCGSEPGYAPYDPLLAPFDCDDRAPEIHPGVRVDDCNHIDDDCDGSYDEDASFALYGPDVDRDGFADPDRSLPFCAPPEDGLVLLTEVGGILGDCNDLLGVAYPGAPELCDLLDNDCDGEFDEGLDYWAVAPDEDGDGYGDLSRAFNVCEDVPGLVGALWGHDCDDEDPTRHPIQEDRCDSVDNDCDGAVDEDDTHVELSPDTDGDGYPDLSFSFESCAPVTGFVPSNRPADCNDLDARISPSAAEVCDELDNDCNGAIDEDFDVFPFGPDEDGDGHGRAEDLIYTCFWPERYALVRGGGDCADDDPSTFPGAPELCDRVDNNCDGVVDDGSYGEYLAPDRDGDGVGTQADRFYSCDFIPGYVRALDLDDCDDSDPEVSPRAPEICDGLDNDCDGAVDEGTSDEDGDGACDIDEPCLDSDADGVCDAVDRCEGDDRSGDFDDDGLCDSEDQMLKVGPIQPGRPADLTAVRLPVAARAYAFLGVRGVGAGRCYPGSDACLGLLGGMLMGEAVADEDGLAQIEVVVPGPPVVDWGDSTWWQVLWVAEDEVGTTPVMHATAR